MQETPPRQIPAKTLKWRSIGLTRQQRHRPRRYRRGVCFHSFDKARIGSTQAPFGTSYRLTGIPLLDAIGALHQESLGGVRHHPSIGVFECFQHVILYHRGNRQHCTSTKQDNEMLIKTHAQENIPFSRRKIHSRVSRDASRVVHKRYRPE